MEGLEKPNTEKSMHDTLTIPEIAQNYRLNIIDLEEVLLEWESPHV